MPHVNRSQLPHVLLSSAPGTKSSWARATGRTYDIRTADYGPSNFKISANSDRIQRGSVGWICHRDGSLGAIAGLIVFDGDTSFEEETGFEYKHGDIWPLPRDYWVDGARLRVRGWLGAPFVQGPTQFQNGREVKLKNLEALNRELHTAVKDWLQRHPLMTGPR